MRAKRRVGGIPPPPRPPLRHRRFRPYHNPTPEVFNRFVCHIGCGHRILSLRTPLLPPTTEGAGNHLGGTAGGGPPIRFPHTKLLHLCHPHGGIRNNPSNAAPLIQHVHGNPTQSRSPHPTLFPPPTPSHISRPPPRAMGRLRYGGAKPLPVARVWAFCCPIRVILLELE